MQTRRWRQGALAMLAVASLAQLAGCTIIRYVEPPPPDNGSQGPPREIDALVMVELDRTTVQLAEGYQQILAGLTAGLAEENIMLRKVALAPMYRRSGQAVPLIYGQGDPDAEFESYAEAIAFFAQDGGQRYLRQEVDADGENLAALGMEMGTRSIYHPTSADTNATPYYSTPADGFLVVQLTARARECAHSDVSCQLDGDPAATYFTRESGGQAQWLELAGGQGLDLGRVFFLNIATAEQVDEETFVRQCEGRAGFNQSALDYMEPSPNSYYEPLSSQITERGGWARYVDMCQALSPVESVPKLARVSREISDRLSE